MDNSKTNTFAYTTTVSSMLADLHTPVGVYLRLRDLGAVSVLMESSDYHDKDNSRSFIGVNPLASIAVAHGRIECSYPDGTRTVSSPDEQLDSSCIADAFNAFLQRFDITGEQSNHCGLYGYTSFNAVRYFEQIEVKDETLSKNDAPDIVYTLFRDILVFDHFNNKLTIITLGGQAGMDELRKALLRQSVQTFGFKAVGSPSSTVSDEEFRATVRRCVGHCLRGVVFQIVPSRRFCQHYEGDDFTLYRTLRSVNPSPYLFYFDFGGFRIFGSSPETHCRIEGEKAYIDPIAGTTPRTGNAEADRRGAEFLRNDPKENAEHVMLVDLARNDLSRNCHEVQVDFYKDMQYYSHVIHLVSRVSGKLNAGADKIRAFFDTFPAGTLSGAPKVRALQSIAELEPHNRGAYGGCIGFVGMNGDVNQAIVIRTFISRNNELWMQAGCGVVAKSNDQYELREVGHKLGALVKAIEMAQNQEC